MDKVLSVLKNSKILGIVGAILLIIGNFFSFATVKMFWVEESVSFIEGDGVFVLILGILALLIIFIDFILSKIPEGKLKFLFKLRNQKIVLIPAIISAIILFVDGSEAFEYGSAGLGFYLLLIGVIALAIYPFLYKGDK